MNEPPFKVDVGTIISRPPYHACPQCGCERFGICHIANGHFIRRCGACGARSPHLPLPPLRKKLIYLDQFVISEMGKVDYPSLKRNPAGKLLPHWAKILELLNLLVDCQLVACPESESHFLESLAMNSGYEALKSVYEGMSAGVKFKSPDEIQMLQIQRTLRAWLRGEQLEPVPRIHVIEGNIDAWQDSVRITINIDWSEMGESFRCHRDALKKALDGVFRQWQGDSEWTFDDWVREETLGAGKGLCRSFEDAREKWRSCMANPETCDIEESIPYLQHPLHRLLRKLKHAGVPCDKVGARLEGFFQSKDFSEIPSIKIAAHMYAAVARQGARGGRRRPPNRGLSTDVAMISAYLPYCDAMFIDKECWTCLGQEPVKSRLHVGENLFSVQNVDEFVSYLTQISSATKRVSTGGSLSFGRA